MYCPEEAGKFQIRILTGYVSWRPIIWPTEIHPLSCPHGRRLRELSGSFLWEHWPMKVSLYYLITTQRPASWCYHIWSQTQHWNSEAHSLLQMGYNYSTLKKKKSSTRTELSILRSQQVLFGVGARVSCLLSKCSTAELHLQTHTGSLVKNWNERKYQSTFNNRNQHSHYQASAQLEGIRRRSVVSWPFPWHSCGCRQVDYRKSQQVGAFHFLLCKQGVAQHLLLHLRPDSGVGEGVKDLKSERIPFPLCKKTVDHSTYKMSPVCLPFPQQLLSQSLESGKAKHPLPRCSYQRTEIWDQKFNTFTPALVDNFLLWDWGL